MPSPFINVELNGQNIDVNLEDEEELRERLKNIGNDGLIKIIKQLVEQVSALMEEKRQAEKRGGEALKLLFDMNATNQSITQNQEKLEKENQNLIEDKKKLEEENQNLIEDKKKLEEEKQNLIQNQEKFEDENKNLIEVNRNLIEEKERLEEELKNQLQQSQKPEGIPELGQGTMDFITQLSGKCQGLSRDNDDNELIRRLPSTLKNLDLTVDNFRNTRKSLFILIIALSHDRDELLSKNQILQDKDSALRDELTKKEELQKEKDTIINNLEKEKDTIINNLEKENEILRATNTNLGNQVFNMKQKITELEYYLEQTNIKLQKEKVQLQNMQSENEGLKQGKVQKDANFSALDDPLKELSEEVNDLNQQNTSLVGEMKEQISKITLLGPGLSQMKNQLENLNKENQNLKQQIQNLQTQLTQKNVEIQQQKDIGGKVYEAEERLQNMMNENDQLKKEKQNLIQNQEKLKEENQNLIEDKEKLEEENQNLIEDKKKLEEEKQNLNEDKEKLEEEKQNLIQNQEKFEDEKQT
ncbi:MAG: hypothetical protein LBI95_00560, partial [Holosporales bacterium]|nr:hypothetical protein [Holosporales bacterium]